MSDKPEKFEWESSDGTVIALPSMRSMKAGVLRRHRKLEPVDFTFTVLEEVADKATITQVDELSVDDLNALFEAWQGDVTPGESSPSSS